MHACRRQQILQLHLPLIDYIRINIIDARAMWHSAHAHGLLRMYACGVWREVLGQGDTDRILVKRIREICTHNTRHTRVRGV